MQEKANTTGKYVGGVTSNSSDCLNLGEWENGCANGDTETFSLNGFPGGLTFASGLG